MKFKGPTLESVKSDPVPIAYTDPSFQTYSNKPNDNKCARILTNTVVSSLILCGFAVLSIQSSVYSLFTQNYDASSLPSDHFGTNWDDFYTAWILTSASINVLVAVFLYIAFKAQERYSMIIGIVISIIAAGASVVAVVFASNELVKLYDEQEKPPHICVESQSIDSLDTECNTWWWMELTVAILSGISFIFVSIGFINFCVIVCKDDKKQKTIDLNSIDSSSVSSVRGQQNAFTQQELWIPRIPYHKSDTDHIEKRIQSMIKSRRMPQKQQINVQPIGRAPPTPKQVPSRQSLPIVIREQTNSRYFY